MNLYNLILILSVAGIGGLTYIYFLNRIIVRTEMLSRKISLGLVFVFLVLLPVLFALKSDSNILEYYFLAVCITFLMLNGLITLILKSRYCATAPDMIADVAEMKIKKSEWITTRTLRKKHYSLFFPSIKETIKIVHISDIHITDKLPMSYFMNVIKQVEDENPDVFVVTGDFLDRKKHLHLLGQMLKPIGEYANLYIDGNHDIWHGAEKIEEMLNNIGFHKVNRHAYDVKINDSLISFNNYTAPWEKCKTPELNEKADVNICLTHTADNIFKIASQKFDIVLTGHYHAGQWRLPIVGSVVVPSLYGKLFDIGHFMVKQTHLYVNSGIGLAHPAFRFCCHP